MLYLLLAYVVIGKGFALGHATAVNEGLQSMLRGERVTQYVGLMLTWPKYAYQFLTK